MSLPDSLEDALNQVLSSPEQLRKIMELAKSLSGASDGTEEEHEASPASPLSLPSVLADPRMLGLLSRILSAYRTADNKDTLVSAMEPFLREERRQALRKALLAAKITRAAKAALREMGGNPFV